MYQMAFNAHFPISRVSRSHEVYRNTNQLRCRSKSVNPPKQANVPPRYVPPFSIQSNQRNTIVIEGPIEGSPSTASARGKLPSKAVSKPSKKKSVSTFELQLNPNAVVHNPRRRKTSFRMYFDRGDLPIKMEYLCGGDKIGWIDIDKLDYNMYLPLFFDGLSETKHPYKTYARQGVMDLLAAGGDRIPPVVPQLILPLKNALSTRNLETMCTTLKIIQQLVRSHDMVGPALVPFYRQLLPMFNAYKVKNLNCGDAIDYGQKKNMNLGDLIDETLQVLEMHGGEDAFINIKYMVPTYESCCLN